MIIKKGKKRVMLKVDSTLVDRVFSMADGARADGGGKIVMWVHPSGDVAVIPYSYSGTPEEFEALWKLVVEEVGS